MKMSKTAPTTARKENKILSFECNLVKIFSFVLVFSFITLVVLIVIMQSTPAISGFTAQERSPVATASKHKPSKTSRISSKFVDNKSTEAYGGVSVSVKVNKHRKPIRNSHKVKKPEEVDSLLQKQQCPDVLRLMSVGKWVQKKTSKQEFEYTRTFLKESRKKLGLPEHLSRSDGRCNNIGLPGQPGVRAMCDPLGDKPCCHKNTCKALPVEKCRCDDCYDVRQRIHAEHATWTPEDKRCKMKNFTASEACSLLAGSQLYLIGDSFMRHLHSAFMMITKNDGLFGALKKGTPAKCGGMYTYGDKYCRSAVDASARLTSLCDGKFKLSFISHARNNYAPQFLQLVNRTLNKEKVVLVASQGAHDNCSITKTRTYLEDGVRLLKSRKVKWPLLIWATIHAPGLLKSSKYSEQAFDKVKAFNEKMIRYLEKLNIPIVDTFNMTSETVSFDGTHYGLGVNIAKAQLFLNYLSELRDRGKW